MSGGYLQRSLVITRTDFSSSVVRQASEIGCWVLMTEKQEMDLSEFSAVAGT